MHAAYIELCRRMGCEVRTFDKGDCRVSPNLPCLDQDQAPRKDLRARRHNLEVFRTAFFFYATPALSTGVGAVLPPVKVHKSTSLCCHRAATVRHDALVTYDGIARSGCC